MPRESARVRELVSLARATPAYDLDPRLTIRELIAERALIGGKQFTQAGLDEAMTLFDIDPPRHSLVGALSAPEQILFATALAVSEGTAAVVVDDADIGCTGDERLRVWDALMKLSFRGFTVLASSTFPPPTYDDGTITVIELEHPSSRRAATDDAKGN